MFRCSSRSFPPGGATLASDLLFESADDGSIDFGSSLPATEVGDYRFCYYFAPGSCDPISRITSLPLPPGAVDGTVISPQRGALSGVTVTAAGLLRVDEFEWELFHRQCPGGPEPR